MTDNSKEIILGHQLNERVRELKSQVQTIFPNKRYHIGKLADALTEQGNPVKTDCFAVSMPEITECIAIWINPALSNDEFNSVLAEELYHNIQASENFPTIIGLDPIRFGTNFARYALQLEAYCKDLVSIICDLDAHRRMARNGIDLNPLLKTDLQLVRNAIDQAIASESKLTELKAGKASVASFPLYLLWWFDLYEMGFPEYSTIWNKEIREWFAKTLPTENIKIWDGLTAYVHNNPVVDSQSAKLVLDFICRELLYGAPCFVSVRTSGRSVPNLC